MSLRNNVVGSLKNLVRILLPLSIRKNIAKKICTLTWLSSDQRAGWSLELVRDMSDRDVNEYHKFLWSNHIAYADTYEIEQRFGDDNINESRKLLFKDIQKSFTDLKIDYTKDIDSVFDVGCSLGYLLKYMSDNIFIGATDLCGVDIDSYAIEKGNFYLNSKGSNIKLQCLDMEGIEAYLNEKMFDVIFCAGTIGYLDENKATNLVQLFMKHTSRMLIITGLACPDHDNRELMYSNIRQRDGTFIHNLDAMVHEAGGNIVFRRWQGKKTVGDNSIYFVFATT